MSTPEEDLGTLICMMNPYTNGAVGSMDPHMFVESWSATPTTPSAGGSSAGAAISPPTGPTSPSPTGSNVSEMGNFWMEIDDKYPASWSFKGQPQKVNTALRIGYRWKKTVPGRPDIWVTDYLLVGFEGSGGGE
jgi:hypothetical protein